MGLMAVPGNTSGSLIDLLPILLLWGIPMFSIWLIIKWIKRR